MADAVEAREGVGLRGAVPAIEESPRRVPLMIGETFKTMGLQPGAAIENITSKGLLLMTFKLGQQQQIGDAFPQIARPCTPCRRSEEIRSGLQEAFRDRQGMLDRVVQGGLLRIGNCIHQT